MTDAQAIDRMATRIAELEAQQKERDAAQRKAGAAWALRHLANEIGLGPFPQYSPLIGHLLASADRIERGEVEVPDVD